ncbi:FadR/GntR family transcriptional regulator [Fictibacillus enclensis]|uniref:FadR/GntR family transcriptional regulator n=1 Tax=Fictibacillus enclensis TaxID=1017270 RepID=UPI0025A2245D|nr:FadR/GntR family transcriptional regulator [Fictibacillus enclensis]MDM5196560.1 FadR/GntR family transcriptional regulator [Fictibacillus enclensis]
MFEVIGKKKKFEEVLDQIKKLLITKKLRIGQKLPNEIELSESMGISRSSLREAFKVLSVLGIIEGKSGEGTVIKQANPENLKSIMSLVAISRGLDTNELFEVRTILEMAAVSYTAARRTEKDLQEINNILLEMDDHFLKGNEEAQAHFDFLFHQSIVTASQNKMLLILVEVISDLLGEQIRTTRSELATSPKVLKRFQEEHWSIYKAIKNKDSKEAQQIMSDHLTLAKAELGLLKEE